MQRQNPETRNHRRTQPPRWIALVVVLVIGVGGYLLFSGGGPAKKIKEIISGPEPVPEFAFEVTKANALPVDDTEPAELQGEADEVTAAVNERIDLLYTEAFLDPNTWKDGSYDGAFDLFTEEAAAAAREQTETLTLGQAAGDTFQTVDPATSRLAVKVLFDADGSPFSAVAVVRFRALATERGGGAATAIVSDGTYFLRDLGDGWQIYSFSVDRADTEAPLPSPEPSASAETS